MVTADKIFKSIKNAYTTNKTAYSKYYAQRVNVDEQLKECCKGTRLTENYYRDLKSNLEEVRQACNTKLEEVTETARTTLYNVLEVALKEFRSFNTSELDSNAIELLKADILTVAELEELAKDFETNRTMTRIIGKEIARKAGATASGELREKIAVMTASDNGIIEAVKGAIDMSLSCLGAYKPLDKTNTAYNRQDNDGADLAIIMQESYFTTIEPLIKNALAIEVMNNYKGAKSEDILNNINNNAFYQQIKQEQSKEVDAIAEAKANAEAKRKKALEHTNDFKRIVESDSNTDSAEE